jgi:hypothetical protein
MTGVVRVTVTLIGGDVDDVWSVAAKGDGSFSVDVPEGMYVLSATQDGKGTSTVERASVRVGESVETEIDFLRP